MIKTLIFDFGGVIATISRDKAVAAFTRIGLNDADARLDKYHQSGIFQALEEGKLDEIGFRTELGRLCNRELSFEEVKKAWLGFFVEVPPAILKYLEELKKEYRILILSNTNPYVMSWACSTEFSSEGKPLTHYADRLYLSYQIGYTKPAPEIFRHLIDDSGICPEEALFVDDGASNVKKRRRIRFPYILSGKRQRLAFRPLGSSATTRVKTRFDSKSRKASFPDKTQESSRAHARPDMTSISIAAHHREESGFPPLYRQE